MTYGNVPTGIFAEVGGVDDDGEKVDGEDEDGENGDADVVLVSGIKGGEAVAGWLLIVTAGGGDDDDDSVVVAVVFGCPVTTCVVGDGDGDNDGGDDDEVGCG